MLSKPSALLAHRAAALSSVARRLSMQQTMAANRCAISGNALFPMNLGPNQAVLSTFGRNLTHPVYMQHLPAPHRSFSTVLEEPFVKLDVDNSFKEKLMERQRQFDRQPKECKVAYKYFRELNRH